MIDRDFEQVSEEHMKSMTKPEGPAQERVTIGCSTDRDHPLEVRGDGTLWCLVCDVELVHGLRVKSTESSSPQPGATPAPSQPAGAREFFNEICLYVPIDHRDKPMLMEVCKRLAQHTAAKDAALEAAERERDSLRAENERLRENWKIKAQQFMDDIKRMVEAHEAENAALKAGKDGQQ